MILGFDRLRNWLASDQKVTSATENLQELPFAYKQQIRQHLADLPAPDKISTYIQNAVEDAIAAWQSDRPSINSLVILESPIEPLGDYIERAIKAISNLPKAHFISFPVAVSSQQRMQQLQKALAAIPRDAKAIILPNLAKGFLRCIGGLDSIEALQTAILENRDRFWIVGCPSWTWEFLDRTHHLKSSFSQTINLPALDSQDLETWLKDVDIDILIEAGEEQNSSYFQSLEKAALGLSQVAQNLWISSLFCPQEKSEIESIQLSVRRQAAILPELAGLSLEDCYLLYSLLLHQQLDLKSLALSLGTDRALVQSQLQQLHHHGLIQQSDGIYQVNPRYYPQIRLDLKRSKFLIP
jgi:hypothetical protein